jgi:hypothetical protein
MDRTEYKDVARSSLPPLGRLASIALSCLLLVNASADYSAV